MKLFPSISLVVFMLLATNVLHAQNSGLDAPLMQLFDKPDKVVWVKHYNGKIDDLHDVTVSLAYDGKHCKGQMKYLRSREIYGLAGYIKNEKIRLHEIDHNKNVSAYIDAKIENNAIVGDWSKHDNSISGNLMLNEANKAITLPTYCGKDKWVRTFSGLIDYKDVDLLLQVQSEGVIQGTAFFYNLNKTYSVIGDIGEQNKINVSIYDEQDNLYGTLSGYLSKKGIIEAGYTGKDDKQQMCSFWEQKEWPVSCVEYTEYMGSYDITYPRTKHAGFNEWLKRTSDEWLKECRHQIKSHKESGKKLTTADRLSVRAYGSCDLNFVSTTIVSGSMVLNTSWEDEVEVRAFNYDLKSGKNLTIEDLFEEGFDYQNMVWSYQIDLIKEHKYYKDYNFRKWLSEESFVAFAIQQDGINFSTGHSPLFGQYKVTVPYDELVEYFKKDSPIWEIANLGEVQVDLRNGN